MKLLEIVSDSAAIGDPVPDDLDQKAGANTELAHKNTRTATPRAPKNSNVEKAKRIRSRAKLKARAADIQNIDTPSQGYDNGHFSNWLQR